MAGSKQRRIFLFSFNFRDLWLAMMLRKNGPSSSGVVVFGWCNILCFSSDFDR